MALLEIIVLDEQDARLAAEGGADAVEVVGTMKDDGLSPDARTVEEISALGLSRVRPMLRLRGGFGSDAQEIRRLRRLLSDYRDAGADGVVLGFLDGSGAVDVETTVEVVGGNTQGWTFHRAVDHSGDRHEAWEAIKGLPGIDQVLTAGAAGGVDSGIEELVSRASGDPVAARLTMAGGGLAPRHVPPLVRAGVRAFHVGSSARKDGSFRNPVSPQLVAFWRDTVDTAVRAF